MSKYGDVAMPRAPAIPGADVVTKGCWQFRLSTLVGFTLLIGVLCGLFRFGSVYFAIGVSLTYGVVLVRLFVRSAYQTHARVIGTLIGGVLYLASLWLPVESNWEIRGWQAARYAAEVTTRIRLQHALDTRAWDVAEILVIDMGNLLALILPPLVIWKPQRLSRVTTLLATLTACGAWGFLYLSEDIAVSPAHSGYWLWCTSLTLLVIARVVPFRVRFGGDVEQRTIRT